ncbi:MAG: hypothetical protein KC912_22405 [Proteobacteria bacterium]|nr:hypothetical protein [Pseudomonadota bacterium]
MAAHWILSLDDTFVETELDGQTGFVRDDQAVILAPFETDVSADAALDQIASEDEGVIERIARSGDQIRREAVLIERRDPGMSRFALQGFAATEGSLLAVAFYYEQPADREWAIAAFESVDVA